MRNCSSLEEVHSFGDTDKIYNSLSLSLSFSDTSKSILATEQSGGVSVWDFATGRLIQQFENAASPKLRPGKNEFAMLSDEKIAIRELTTGNVIKEFDTE